MLETCNPCRGAGQVKQSTGGRGFGCTVRLASKLRIRRVCWWGLPAPTANDMRPSVPALRCGMSFYANQHTWRRPLNYAPNTWHTHTHKYTRHSRTLADKPALEYNNSLPTFRRPLKFVRVVFDFASFLQRGQRLQCALASLPLISPSWPCHAQWAWQVIWQHTFQFALCLPFCFVVSFVGLPDKPNQQSKKRRRGKGRATGCAAILKTSWETCQRVLCRQQVFQLCPPYLGSCVCVIFS